MHLLCLVKHTGGSSCHSLPADFLCHTMHPMLHYIHLLLRQCYEGMSTPEQQTTKHNTTCSSGRARHSCQTFSMFFLELPPSSSIVSMSFKTCKYFETEWPTPGCGLKMPKYRLRVPYKHLLGLALITLVCYVIWYLPCNTPGAHNDLTKKGCTLGAGRTLPAMYSV